MSATILGVVITTKQEKTAAYVDYIERLIEKGEMADDKNIDTLPFGKRKHIRKLFNALRWACGSEATAYNFIDAEMERRGL